MRLYSFCISFAALSSGCIYGDIGKCEDTSAGGCETAAEATYYDVDGGGYDDVDGGGYDSDDATFSVTWTGSSIDVAVINPHPHGYYFGLAETGAGDGGWYGEDGISGDALHEMYDSLSLGCVATPWDVVGSSTTLLCDFESSTTYAFFGNENGDNWGSVSFCGGDDCSYYE